MAKAQRFNNKLVRCGNAITTACTCGEAPCVTICDLDTANDVLVTFDNDMSDCDDLGHPCNCPSGCICEGVFNGNSFQCVWNGGVNAWVYTLGNTTVFVQCYVGTQLYVLAESGTPGSNNCFLGALPAKCLPQTIPSVFDESHNCDIGGSWGCALFGNATVSIV